MALSFQVQCEEFAKKLDINIATVVRRAAAQLYSDIVKRWPVDTGYSRRNWQVSVDPPPSDVIGVYPKKVKGRAPSVGGPLYDPQGPDTQLPITDKTATLIWIVNNVEYAEPLEYGWSKQAPNGAVRIAIAQLEAEWKAIMAGVGE
jgi:hypothetical protein